MRKALGEVDYKDKVLVRPTPNADDNACFWVRIKKGNHSKGRGVIITPTKTPTLELGDTVEYDKGTAKKRPLFKRKLRVRNVATQLATEMCKDLAAMMTWHPAKR